MKLILIGIAGVVLEIVWTLMIQAITGRRPIKAAVLQAIFTVLVVGATWSVVKDESVPALISYAVGSAIGTWFVVRFCNVSSSVRSGDGSDLVRRPRADLRGEGEWSRRERP